MSFSAQQCGETNKTTNHLNLNRSNAGKTTNKSDKAIKKPPMTAIAKG